MQEWANAVIDLAQKAWGVFIAIAWGLYEWRRRKGKAAKDNVDTINYLLKSVENLSKKYDELITSNTSLKEEVSRLKISLAEKDEIIERLRARIEELENHK